VSIFYQVVLQLPAFAKHQGKTFLDAERGQVFKLELDLPLFNIFIEDEDALLFELACGVSPHGSILSNPRLSNHFQNNGRTPSRAWRGLTMP
jgi:hypothetical protein